VIDFNGSTLFISARSPFARRVRLAFIENGVRFDEKVFDVFNPAPELLKANPLGRIPVLRLPKGDVVIDSNQILNLFYSENSQSSLLPWGDEDKLAALKWSGLGVGICEKVVEYYLESIRPDGVRWQEILDENTNLIKATLSEFDKFIRDRETICSGGLTQADLDVGCGLGYLSLRHPWNWRHEHRAIARYFDGLSKRTSFETTFPPPQT
jgi:glutathione S-transferase